MSADPRKKIVIIDYGMGNLFSVRQALLSAGADAVVSSDPAVVLAADALVLPGVGAFSQAMQNLQARGLDQAILQSVKAGKSFFGICLGMQLLFEVSEEHGETRGLGVLKGRVKRFPQSVAGKKVRVPQIGWNTLQKSGKASWDASPLHSISEGAYMYFVHSYFVVPEDSAIALCESDYEGVKYCSGVLNNQIFAVQFHPEKSGSAGLQIYKNWLESVI